MGSQGAGGRFRALSAASALDRTAEGAAHQRLETFAELELTLRWFRRPEVLVTPTQDEGKLIAALHGLKQGGDADLSTAIQVAQVRCSRGGSCSAAD